MIETEGENTERSVGLVRAGMGQRCAPKVIQHQIGPWCRRIHVRIGFDGSTVNRNERKNKRILDFSTTTR